jgi:hypothetical protein
MHRDAPLPLHWPVRVVVTWVNVRDSRGVRVALCDCKLPSHALVGSSLLLLAL